LVSQDRRHPGIADIVYFCRQNGRRQYFATWVGLWGLESIFLRFCESFFGGFAKQCWVTCVPDFLKIKIILKTSVHKAKVQIFFKKLFDSFPGKKALLFYATLAYIRHFIFAGCYDNNPWYLVTNLAGHLDLAGFYFSKCPAKFVTIGTRYRPAFSSCDLGSPSLNIFTLPGLEHAPPPDRKLTLYQWAMDAILSYVLVLFKNTRTFMFWRIFSKIFGSFSAKILFQLLTY
jgi:hypothetical protein